MSKYQYIFFDLDHTLWDFEQNSKNTMAQMFELFQFNEQWGIPDFESFYEVYHAHNERLWQRFRMGHIKRNDLRWKRMWHTLLDFKIGNTQLANEMSVAYLEILPNQKVLMPYALECVSYCAQKYPLYIITNGFETTQLQKLYHCKLQSYFKELISSEKASSLKPHKEIFDYAMRKAGAQDPSQCIMIGDAAEIDILGAHNAGWDTVHFNPLKDKSSELATYEIQHLKMLLDIL